MNLAPATDLASCLHATPKPGTPVPAVEAGGGADFAPAFEGVLSDLLGAAGAGADASALPDARQKPAGCGKAVPVAPDPALADPAEASALAALVPSSADEESKAPAEASVAAADEDEGPQQEPALAWLLPPVAVLVPTVPIIVSEAPTSLPGSVNVTPPGVCPEPAKPSIQGLPPSIRAALSDTAKSALFAPLRTDGAPALVRIPPVPNAPIPASAAALPPAVAQALAAVAAPSVAPAGKPEQTNPDTIIAGQVVVSRERGRSAPRVRETSAIGATGERRLTNAELWVQPRPAGSSTEWRPIPRPTAFEISAQPTAVVTATPLRPVETPAQPTTGIDLTRDAGLHRMIDRIETMRDATATNGGTGDTRIRLIPDSLGPVDISVRRDGDSVQVHFTATEAATRQLIADAQPRLAELAEARGVRIERATVDGGATGGQLSGHLPGQAQHRQQPQADHAAAPRNRAAATAEPESIDDERIA